MALWMTWMAILTTFLSSMTLFGTPNHHGNTFPFMAAPTLLSESHLPLFFFSKKEFHFFDGRIKFTITITLSCHATKLSTYAITVDTQNGNKRNKNISLKVIKFPNGTFFNKKN